MKKTTFILFTVPYKGEESTWFEESILDCVFEADKFIRSENLRDLVIELIPGLISSLVEELGIRGWSLKNNYSWELDCPVSRFHTYREFQINLSDEGTTIPISCKVCPIHRLTKEGVE